MYVYIYVKKKNTTCSSITNLKKIQANIYMQLNNAIFNNKCNNNYL